MRSSAKVFGLDKLRAATRAIKHYPEKVAAAATEAANEVAERVMKTAQRDIVARYNLSKRYVDERFYFKKASSRNREAYVAARVRWTRLARFAAKQETVPAPGAKGDPLRGIPQGRKQAGVSFQVLRQGKRHTVRRAFLIPLRSGSRNGANGMGIFWRDMPGQGVGHVERGLIEEEVNTHRRGWRGSQIKHLYGISVHQSFKYWIQKERMDIRAALQTSFKAKLRRKLR